MDQNHKQQRQQMLALLESNFVTEPTKSVLKNRLHKEGSPRFFDNGTYNLLNHICDLLVDQDPTNRMVEIAIIIDERLYKNESDGWRYDRMPPDRIMYQQGLKAVALSSIQKFNKSFLDLTSSQQKELLTSIQNGEVKNDLWTTLDSKLFFEEILTETTAIFFSHPLVQASIHYVGMADAKGWHRIQLNQSEAPEIDWENSP